MIIAMLISALSAVAHPACTTRRPPEQSGVVPTPSAAQLSACWGLAWQAELRGVDAYLVVELAWSETRWRDLTNEETGCRSILQYQPRYWKSGWHALRYYLSKHPETWRGICDYKTRGVPRCSPRDPGCCPSSRRIVKLANRHRTEGSLKRF